MAGLQQRVAAVRRFNRFYTRQLGVLRKTFLDSPYSLGEARLLYEIAHRRTATASEIGRALELDAGYLSRTLRNFEKRGLIERKVSTGDARQSHLMLSAAGRKAFAPLERRSRRDVAATLERLKPADQARLIAAMRTIETLLEGGAEATPQPARDTCCARLCRATSAGSSNATPSFTGEEYGWVAPFEGVLRADRRGFRQHIDPERERCWIAEMTARMSARSCW